MNKTTKLLLGTIVVIAVIVGVSFLTSQKSTEPVTETISVKIAYLPVVQALPLYLAIEKGYFKDVGIEVDAVKLDNPNLIIDALLSGQVDFGAPSTAMGITAISQFKKPNTLKIYALNGGAFPDNIDNVLMVRSDDDSITAIKDLKGKKLGILPGIQFRTIARHLLTQAGLNIDEDVVLVELAVPLQLQALVAKQVDALLTLEPIGVIGRTQGTAKDLVIGPMSKFIADPWYGGGGVVRTEFAKKNPQVTKKIIAVFNKAIAEISKSPNESRQYLKNYTALNDDLIVKVPMPIWKTYDDFQNSDIEALQVFFDIFTKYKVISDRVDAWQMIYN